MNTHTYHKTKHPKSNPRTKLQTATSNIPRRNTLIFDTRHHFGSKVPLPPSDQHEYISHHGNTRLERLSRPPYYNASDPRHGEEVKNTIASKTNTVSRSVAFRMLIGYKNQCTHVWRRVQMLKGLSLEGSQRRRSRNVGCLVMCFVA